MSQFKYLFLSFLSIVIIFFCVVLFQEYKVRHNLESELDFLRVKQNQTEEYLYENIELARISGLDLTLESVRTLDDKEYKLCNVTHAFPKVYIYFSSNFCGSCSDYVMGKIKQINDSIGESCTTLLFYNFDPRQLYVYKVRNNLKNDIYLVGDSSTFVKKLDGMSKPSILLADEKGLITSAYSPTADYDYLFNDYLSVLRTNTFYKKYVRSYQVKVPIANVK